MSFPSLASLQSSLGAAGGALPPDISQMLAEISGLISALPSDGNLELLKKPGAWRHRPLPPNPVDQPYYTRIPCTIEVTDLSPHGLEQELKHNLITPKADAFGNAIITIPPLLKR